MSSFTRREVLLGSAALLVLPSFSEATLPEKNLYAPFRMGIQSYSLRNFQLEEALAKTKSLGLKFWEAYPGHIPVTSDPVKQAEIKVLLAKYDIELRTFGVVDFSKNEQDARTKFEFAKAMGIETLSAYPSLDSIDLLDRLTQEYKINKIGRASCRERVCSTV